MTRLACAALAALLAAALGAGEAPAPGAGGPGAEPVAAAAGGPGYATVIDGQVLHADSLEFQGLSFFDVVAVPRLADQVLTFADCRAIAYGGTATATVSIDLASSLQRYRIELVDIDLARFLARFANTEDGTRGRLDGWIELSVPGGDSAAMTGTGELSIRDGNILQMGILASLLVGDPTAKGDRDTASARLVIGDGKVALRAARIVSPGAVLKIRGDVGFDGELDLVVIPYPEVKWIQVVPGLGDLAAWLVGTISSRVARAAVRGHVSSPVIVINPFAD